MGKLKVSAKQRRMQISFCDPEAGVMEHAFLELGNSVGGGELVQLGGVAAESCLDQSRNMPGGPGQLSSGRFLVVYGTPSASCIRNLISRNWNDSFSASDQ